MRALRRIASIAARCKKAVITRAWRVESACSFYSARNARIASAVLAIAIPSVRLSVRHMPVLCQNDGTYSTVQFAPLDSKMCLVL